LQKLYSEFSGFSHISKHTLPEFSNTKTVEMQLAEKDKQLNDLKQKQEKVEQLIQTLIDSGQLKPAS
jgi:cell shape-determining protein MreC